MNGDNRGSLISLMSNMVKSQGGINLAQGIPAFSPPEKLLLNLKNIVHLPLHQYPPGDGHPEIRQFIKEYFLAKGLENYAFLITQGATEALTLLYTYLWTTEKGKLPTLTFDPAYESFVHLPRIFRQTLYQIPLSDNNQIDFQLLQRYISDHRIKLVMIASPGNPLGKAFEREEWLKLFKLTHDSGIYLIIDLVYHELYYNKQQDIPLQAIHPRVFLTFSFSKLFSITGWRLGAIGISEEQFLDLKNIHDYTDLCASSILQEALARFISDRTSVEKYVTNLRNTLSENYRMAFHELTSMGFKVAKAQGGYFVWAALPEPFTDGFGFAMELYKTTKVAVVPGIHFSRGASSFIRINIARSYQELSSALTLISHMISKSKA